MSLERKKGTGLRAVLTGRSKGSGPKDVSSSELPPPLPPLTPSVNPFASANHEERENDKEVPEKGELVPHTEKVPPKLPKRTKGKGKASFSEGREASLTAKVHPLNPMWSPQLKLDGAAIPWNSTIKEFQRGNAHYLAEALEQSILLSNDMEALRGLK